MASYVTSRNLTRLAILTGIYFLAGKIGLKFAFVNQSATALWPCTGIALAALLRFGYGMWAAIFVGAFLVNFTTQGSLLTSLAIGAGNTLEAVSGAYLINHFAGGCSALDHPQRVFRFLVLGGLLSTALSATIGVITLCVAGLAAWQYFGTIWLTWWLGDCSGAVLVAPPLILAFTQRSTRFQWRRYQLLESMVLLMMLCIVGFGIFGTLFFEDGKHYPLEFICIPIMVLIAFRFGQREAALATLLLGLMAAYGTLNGYGPFAVAAPNESLLLLQAFMTVLSITSLAITADITQREATEEALIAKATALARSNAELEQFAYLASHDMQEPLRTVANYVQLLEKRYADRLDEEGRGFIRHAVNGVARMRELIKDLLGYSRIGTQHERQCIAAKAAVDVALANLRQVILENKAVITSDELPMVWANHTYLIHLFQNLIGNAIKFRGADIPRIHILVQERGQEWIIGVRDNGIGIESIYYEQIFGIFKRLHKSSEYPGTGIGLAVCRQIVQKMNGRIWVESVVGKGSTFYFSLPKTT